MRDHNTITLSGHLKDAPATFGEGTTSGCQFIIVVHDEWRNTTTGQIEERTDFIGIVCHGPVRPRAMCLQRGDRVLITGRIRNKGGPDGKTKIDARTIETIRHISPNKDTPHS